VTVQTAEIAGLAQQRQVELRRRPRTSEQSLAAQRVTGIHITAAGKDCQRSLPRRLSWTATDPLPCSCYDPSTAESQQQRSFSSGYVIGAVAHPASRANLNGTTRLDCERTLPSRLSSTPADSKRTFHIAFSLPPKQASNAKS
jgi:hypothetical protein